MAIFTVFEPPARDLDSVEHAGRFTFVRDGFSWPAFLFGPLWMLRYWLILELIAWVVLIAAVVILARLLPMSSTTTWTLFALIALLIGFEASTLRRWALRRRGWLELGIVAADDLEGAERRFFDRWTTGEGTRTVAPRDGGHRAAGSRWPAAPDVIGSFPQPGATR
jgi:Protein of unknown function (DUF2628)